MEVITYKAARDAGLKKYFTGKPCGRGHIAERSTANAGCLECHRERIAGYKAADPVAWRKRQNAHNQQYLAARPDYHAQSYAKHKAKIQARVNAWLEARPEYKTGRNRQRLYRIKRATPNWLTDEQRREMTAIYEEASGRAGGPWHVDHIIPLQGKTVCGLHVPWNLQILSKAENLAKGAFIAAP